MKRLIHTVALTAALAALGASLMRDYSVLTVFKKVTVSYLAFFFISSLLALVYRVGVLAAGEEPGAEAPKPPADQTASGA